MEKSLYTPDHLKEQEITKQLEFIWWNVNFVQSLVRKDEYQKETEKHIVEKYLNFLKLLLKKMDVDVKTKTISFDINWKKYLICIQKIKIEMKFCILKCSLLKKSVW